MEYAPKKRKLVMALFGFSVALHMWLSFAAIVNFLNVEYFPFFQEFRKQTIHIVFFSIYSDKLLLFALTILVFLLPFAIKLRNLSLTLVSFFLFFSGVLLSYFGLEAVSNILVAFSGLLCLAITILDKSFFVFCGRRYFLTQLAIFIVFFLFAIEIVVFPYRFLYPDYLVSSVDFLGRMRDLEAEFFYVLSAVASIMFFLTLFSWIVVPLISIFKSVARKFKGGESFLTSIRVKFTGVFEDEPKSAWKAKYFPLALACSIGLVSFLVLYPYFPSLNPAGKHVGVDIPNYVHWLEHMGKEDWLSAVVYAFSNLRDRPLSLLMMYVVWRNTGLSVWTVAQFWPLVLGPLLVLAACFFGGEMKKGRFVYLVAFFAVFTFPVTVGMYAGFLSNWLGLVWLCLFSGLFLKSVREKSWRFWLFALATMLLLLFTHEYTWASLMGVLLVYAFLLFVKMLRVSALFLEFRMVAVMIMINAALNVGKNLALGSVGFAPEAVNVAVGGLSLTNLFHFWEISFETFNYGLGGFFMNPVVLLLAFVGAFSIFWKCSPSNRYLLSWLVASSIPFVFGNATMQKRILYNFPFLIFAPLGLDFVVRLFERFLSGRYVRVLSFLFVAVVVLINLNYAFRCVFELSRWSFPVF